MIFSIIIMFRYIVKKIFLTLRKTSQCFVSNETYFYNLLRSINTHFPAYNQFFRFESKSDKVIIIVVILIIITIIIILLLLFYCFWLYFNNFSSNRFFMKIHEDERDILMCRKNKWKTFFKVYGKFFTDQNLQLEHQIH